MNDTYSPDPVTEGPGIMQWFDFTHLPEDLQQVSKPFHDLAWALLPVTIGGAEQSVALRKLLESKDAAVRSAVQKREV